MKVLIVGTSLGLVPDWAARTKEMLVYHDSNRDDVDDDDGYDTIGKAR